MRTFVANREITHEKFANFPDGGGYAHNEPCVGTSLLSRLASRSRVLKSVSRLTTI